MGSLNNPLNNICSNEKVSIFLKIWNIYNLQVRLWLRKPQTLYDTWIYIVQVFYIFFNNVQVRCCSNLVCGNNNILVVRSNEVNQNFWFYIFEESVHVRACHYSFYIVSTYRNYDLFSRGFFYSHIESRFTLLTQFVNDVDFINLVNWNFGKCFFDLNNNFDVTLGSLSIGKLIEIRVQIYWLILFILLQLGQNIFAWSERDRQKNSRNAGLFILTLFS